jgi:uncharacterized membrane protein YccF (DUF307 family)
VKTLGNLVWFVVAGLGLAVSYVVAGVICCVLIVTIPFGLQSFKIAGYVVWPFGRSVVDGPSSSAGVVGNVIWFIFAGWWLVIAHVLAALLLAVTIIGLPFAAISLRMAVLAMAPFGKVIVPSASVDPRIAVVSP